MHGIEAMQIIFLDLLAFLSLPLHHRRCIVSLRWQSCDLTMSRAFTKIDGLLQIDRTSPENSKVPHSVRIWSHSIRWINQHIALLFRILWSRIAAVVTHLSYDMIGAHKWTYCVAWKCQVPIVSFYFRYMISQKIVELLLDTIFTCNTLNPPIMLICIH